MRGVGGWGLHAGVRGLHGGGGLWHEWGWGDCMSGAGRLH